MQKNNRFTVGVIGVVVLLFVFGGSMMMGGWGYRGWNMMGPGGMMGNWGASPSPLNWVGMIFMWLFPVGLLLLAAFGIIWLVKNNSNPKPPSS
jgi:hypothetical protein